jgi:hypothetical protein
MGAVGYMYPHDVEMFERMQDGMKQVADPWKYMVPGMKRERLNEDIGAAEAIGAIGLDTGSLEWSHSPEWSSIP